MGTPKRGQISHATSPQAVIFEGGQLSMRSDPPIHKTAIAMSDESSTPTRLTRCIGGQSEVTWSASTGTIGLDPALPRTPGPNFSSLEKIAQLHP